MRDHSNATDAIPETLSGSKPAPPPTHLLAAWLWGGLGVLAFSFTLPATRLALADLDSTVVGLGRALGAAILSALLLALRRQPIPPRRLWSGLVIVALGCVVGFPLFSALALRTVPAAHGAVIVGLVPMATAVIGALRGGERPSPAFWAASILGLAAVLVFAAIQGAGRPQPADGLILIAVALAAWGYAEGAIVARQLGAWQVICWALVMSAPVLAPIVLVRAAETGISAGPIAWLGFAYVSIVSMFLGFFAWYRGLALGGVARIGQIQLAQPVLTLVWSAALLGETVSTATILAALAVMACVVLTQRARIVSRPR